MAIIGEALRQNPELALFLALALGFLVGRLRLGNFSLGPVLGTLLAAVLIGQSGVTLAPAVRVFLFDLFLFATGYKVGPQFFRGLKKDALPQVVLTLVICVASLLTSVGLARLLGYDMGTAVGLLAGAFSESTVIGTASEAIQRLGLPAAESARLVNNIPVAYAVTYLVGTTAVVWFLSWAAPRLLRVDLPAASRALESALTGRVEVAGVASAYQAWDVRAIRLEGTGPAGRTVAQLEQALPGERLFVERLRRGGAVSEPGPGEVLAAGDVVAVRARRDAFLGPLAALGPEVTDPELLDFPVATVEVVVTRREVAGQTLDAVATLHGRGLVLRRLVRAGQEIPFALGTVLELGDQLQVAGQERTVERAGQALGHLSRPSPVTDVPFLGLGIFVGGIIGLLGVKVGGIELTLTSSGGALVAGLVLGWWRSTRPTFGRIPEEALWVFDNIGLAGFIGAIGLSAGPGFVDGVRQTGPGLVAAGLVAALLPHVVGLAVGRLVLRMEPVVLLGACAGAGTTTAGLKAVQDAARSRIPVLGYTVPYAVGNILLTAWGPVIVALMR
jgi:putative transport protein